MIVERMKNLSSDTIKTALWAGFIGGNLSSFVKWGSEIPFPPRTIERISPPFQMLQDMGIPPNILTYTFSGHVIDGSVALSHHIFSIVFGIMYCVFCLVFPKIRMMHGAIFGIVVTVLFHGVLLPVSYWAPPLWQLPTGELFSEFFGHILWGWCIDICCLYKMSDILKKIQ